MAQVMRWVLRLLWAICCALFVCLVPASASWADTGPLRSSASFSLSAGSLPGCPEQTRPPAQTAFPDLLLARTSTPSLTVSGDCSTSSERSSVSRSRFSQVALTHDPTCRHPEEPVSELPLCVDPAPTATVTPDPCGLTVETACFVELTGEDEPIPPLPSEGPACGTVEMPCQMQAPVEDRALYMLGFGLLVMLGGATLISGWGSDS